MYEQLIDTLKEIVKLSTYGADLESRMNHRLAKTMVRYWDDENN